MEGMVSFALGGVEGEAIHEIPPLPQQTTQT